MKQNITSPITGSLNTKVVDSIKTSYIIENYKILYNIDLTNYFNNLDRINVIKCLDTNYYFYFPSIQGDSKFYEYFEKFDWYYKTEKWEYDKVYDIIENNSSILEIGSGKGYFLDRLKDKNCTLNSIELNQSAIKTLNEKGINVYNLTLEQFDEKYPENKYDYIISFQLMEHIYNVGEFIQIFEKHLKINGKIIIAVPNNESICVNYKYNLLNLPPHHAGLWSEYFFNNIQKINNKLIAENVYYEPVSFKNRISASIAHSKSLTFRKKNIKFYFNLPFSLLKYLTSKRKLISENIIGIITKK